ncbi:hypothetical protein DC432_01050 [Microbacterium testaceum]|uniref:Uncharacterized protein n=1 Tax=Microbacterium testaceum TaxID=2033 RepID=A0A2T7WX23_MICTE|nr:hypothetical protein DC432_01050 [Microbacterium testaceum]
MRFRRPAGPSGAGGPGGRGGPGRAGAGRGGADWRGGAGSGIVGAKPKTVGHRRARMSIEASAEKQGTYAGKGNSSELRAPAPELFFLSGPRCLRPAPRLRGAPRSHKEWPWRRRMHRSPSSRRTSRTRPPFC